MSYTPGPWEIEFDQDDEERPWPAWLNAQGHTLLTFDQTTEDDARLIAAAPDLLAALELLRETHAHDGACRGRQCLAMHSAIAKARGTA